MGKARIEKRARKTRGGWEQTSYLPDPARLLLFSRSHSNVRAVLPSESLEQARTTAETNVVEIS